MTSLNARLPYDVGRAIAASFADLPVMRRTTSPEPTLLREAGLSEAAFLEERLLLCACAAVFSAKQMLHDELAKSITDGIRSYLTTECDLPGAISVASNLDETEGYYASAAFDDEAGQNGAEWSCMEMAVGDRLFVLGPENEARAKACLHLASLAQGALWSICLQSTRAALLNAGMVAAA